MIPHSRLPERIERRLTIFDVKVMISLTGFERGDCGDCQERLSGFRDKMMTLLTKALLEAENWVQNSRENVIRLPKSNNDSALTLPVPSVDSIQQFLGCMTKV